MRKLELLHVNKQTMASQARPQARAQARQPARPQLWQPAMQVETIEELKARAEAGDVEAMYEVGRRYFEPWAFITDRNYAAALAWYGKAAALGHGGALYALGYMHENGHGVPKDLIQALNYYKQAKTKGYADPFEPDPLKRVEAAITADPALRAAAAAAAAAVEEQRTAENTRKQHALEQEALRLAQENTRLRSDRAALDADKTRHEQQVAQERAALNADKVRHEQQVARDRAALEADRARLQQERGAFDAVRREQEAQQQAREAAAAAFTAAQQQAAATKQAEILADRHAEGSTYVSTRDAVAASWDPTKVKLADCPVHAGALTPGQSVLLSECLHAICRDCAPHMLQPDNSVRCPVCQAVSNVDPSALPHHPFIEA